MQLVFILFTLISALLVTDTASQFIIGSIVTGLGSSGALYYWKNEWCTGRDWEKSQLVNLASDYVSGGKWINYEPEYYELKRKVFGQHIAASLAVNLVRQHLRNDDPPKALVLSFHGVTGIGKTFLAKHLAKGIYKQYRDTETSSFVHYIAGSTHHRAASAATKLMELMRIIDKGISTCERSFFIIDEVDKYPAGFMDVLIPYLEQPVTIDGKAYNSRKAIFILLSNTGGKEINDIVVKHKSNGYSRETLMLENFKDLFNTGVFTREGGLKDSELVERAFIDQFLPFLPLERSHVKQCIVQYLKDHRNFTNPNIIPGTDKIEQMAEQNEYISGDTEVFSRHGCRRVKGIVDTVLLM